VKPEEVLHKLIAEYGEETLSQASVCDWYSKFDGHEEVLNLLHTHIQPTIVQDIASDSGISIGSVETSISEHLSFKLMCVKWVSKYVGCEPPF
jgi:hypothetical protein